MIKHLLIKNFKSIKNLEIKCKKINLFIGEPNVGKSNILEAIGFLSWQSYKYAAKIEEYVRFQNIANLFYDELLDEPVEIRTKVSSEVQEPGDLERGIKVNFEGDIFSIENTSYRFDKIVKKLASGEQDRQIIAQLDYNGNAIGTPLSPSEFSFIKFYRFVPQDKFLHTNVSFLLPPHGINMFGVVMGHKKLRETMASFFKDFGYNLIFKPQQKIFEIQKQVGDVVFSYPYIVTSDTLQRIIFYVTAIESNQDSTLIFEEPEAHAFPYYTKYLGEKIAFDETNQYFIATHNPYLLLSILEKAPKETVNLFITYFKDYQTKVKCFTDNQLSKLMNYDPFANLDSFLEEEAG